jgi:hypothetical protein
LTRIKFRKPLLPRTVHNPIQHGSLLFMYRRPTAW